MFCTYIFEYRESEFLAMDNMFAYIVLACQKALLECKVPEEELASDRSIIARALIYTENKQLILYSDFWFMLFTIRDRHKVRF